MLDEPTETGGRDNGPDPLSAFLGSLVGCNQATLFAVAREKNVRLAFMYDLVTYLLLVQVRGLHE